MFIYSINVYSHLNRDRVEKHVTLKSTHSSIHWNSKKINLLLCLETIRILHNSKKYDSVLFG